MPPSPTIPEEEVERRALAFGRVLGIVPVTVAAHCMPWHARASCDWPVAGRVCCYCARAIAAPVAAGKRFVACIYCGFDKGEIPCEDYPIGERPPWQSADGLTRTAQETRA